MNEKIIVIGNLKIIHEQSSRIYSIYGIAPTISTFGGGQQHHKILVYGSDKNWSSNKERNEEISEFAKQYTGKKYRIRKLTPLECYRLMGVSDENAKKMLKVNSNTQCYKQAGNSIVVPVLMALFSQMNIDGVKVWNEMSEDEIYKMIEESQ